MLGGSLGRWKIHFPCRYALFPRIESRFYPHGCGVGVETNRLDDCYFSPGRHGRQKTIRPPHHRVHGPLGHSEYVAAPLNILNDTSTSGLSRCVSLTGGVVRCEFRLQSVVLDSAIACVPGRDQAQHIQLSISPRNLLQDLRHGVIALRIVKTKSKGRGKKLRSTKPRPAPFCTEIEQSRGDSRGRILSCFHRHKATRSSDEGAAKGDLGRLALLMI